ncbi:MAG: hypothetical protein M1500_03020 [Candidatus Marsarchaeota archaeon]|nr:hypothetical protein [Candidatus Marsarchaeota archaeon]MCL5112654.1 hypothetical protein [Candidatus Marsarchaeota archaeon]
MSELIARFLRSHSDDQSYAAWAADPEKALLDLVESDHEVAEAAASNPSIACIRVRKNGTSVAHIIARHGDPEAKMQLSALPRRILDMKDENGNTVWDLLSMSISSSYV